MFSLTCNGKPQEKTYFKETNNERDHKDRAHYIYVNEEQQVGGISGIQFYKIKTPKFYLRLEHYINRRPQLERIPYDERT